MQKHVESVNPAVDSTKHYNPGKMVKGMQGRALKRHEWKIKVEYEVSAKARSSVLFHRRTTLFHKVRE